MTPQAESSSRVLGHRAFSQADQVRFAEWSGDWNPMHVDPVESRRTPYGQVVHGMHLLLWALDAYLQLPDAQAPDRIRTKFLAPARLTDPLDLEQEIVDGVVGLTVRSHDRVLASVRLSVATPAPSPVGTTDATGEWRRTPAVRTIDQVATLHDVTAARLVPAARLAFPDVARRLGDGRLAALLGLSRIVGMECPGLHSVFAGFDVNCTPSTAGGLGFTVVRCTASVGLVRMAVTGSGLEGTLEAFFRPAPVTQLSFAEARALVLPGEFSEQRALVVGGSRGLGEVAAKLIAAGGGVPTVTYRVGEADAQRVVNEITGAGGRCRLMSLDVLAPESSVPATLTADPPTHVYYFASPAIRTNAGSRYDRTLFEDFAAYYVQGLVNLARALGTSHPVRLFFPSTVFLEAPPPGFLEYVAAKAAGEAACGSLAHERPNLAFCIERLERTRTDQTNSLLDRGGAAAHAVLLPVLRHLNALEMSR